MQKNRVLILCVGNSCRSQMAEALINHYIGDRWQAFSAGSEPAGYVHPWALRVLEEIGIHHQGESKPIDTFRGQSFDLIITVCDEAAENCPIWLGKGRKLHIGFDDPSKAEGSEEEVLDLFRQLRDQMRAEILGRLMEFEQQGQPAD